MTVITRTLSNNKILTVEIASNFDIVVYIDGEQVARGKETAISMATVSGRPEVTHVFAGKVALVAGEMSAIMEVIRNKKNEFLLSHPEYTALEIELESVNQKCREFDRLMVAHNEGVAFNGSTPHDQDAERLFNQLCEMRKALLKEVA